MLILAHTNVHVCMSLLGKLVANYAIYVYSIGARLTGLSFGSIYCWDCGRICTESIQMSASSFYLHVLKFQSLACILILVSLLILACDIIFTCVQTLLR